jgi:hypothetical protein
LYRGGVGNFSHLAAESIQFFYELAFCQAAYRGIAGHMAYRVGIHG